jgi:chemotaxis protein methyltransferase CheR
MSNHDELEDVELGLLLEAIHTRYGYDLRGYSREPIRRRIRRVLARSGSRNLGDLQHRLLIDEAFFASSLDDLTVQVSDMFRDPWFYAVLRERIVPVLRTYPYIKVWHAGCAGGEEVYASAILLYEEDLLDRTQIYATDISPGALDRAREGVYLEDRAVVFAANHAAAGGKASFDDYCSRAYGRIAMRESLRRNVAFFQHDLATDSAIGVMNVVFCRNVLIYFGSPLRQRALETLSGSLVRGGFLCLGASERLSDVEGLQALVDSEPGAAIYRFTGS